MLADRSHHVTTVIEPTLDEGIDVIADRFFASTLAYQGYGRGVDLAELWAATNLAIGSCRPDLTFLLDVDVSVARQRGASRQDDRFESVPGDFLERVRDGYRKMAASDSDHWAVVDGTLSEEDVTSRIREVLAERR
jgi:dTMP kinase